MVRLKALFFRVGSKDNVVSIPNGTIKSMPKYEIYNEDCRFNSKWYD